MGVAWNVLSYSAQEEAMPGPILVLAIVAVGNIRRTGHFAKQWQDGWKLMEAPERGNEWIQPMYRVAPYRIEISATQQLGA